MSVRATIISKLTARFKPTALSVVDESAQHAGHAAMKGLPASETHFSLEIVSVSFKGMSKVEMQRAVYATLEEEVKSRVHALRMSCKVPE